MQLSNQCQEEIWPYLTCHPVVVILSVCLFHFEVGMHAQRFQGAQVPIIVSMTWKWYQAIWHHFLVRTGLDFMENNISDLSEVLPSVAYIQNVIRTDFLYFCDFAPPRAAVLACVKHPAPRYRPQPVVQEGGERPAGHPEDEEGLGEKDLNQGFGEESIF